MYTELYAHLLMNVFIYLWIYVLINESICLSTCLFTQGHENREIFCFLVSPFPIQGPVASGLVVSCSGSPSL